MVNKTLYIFAKINNYLKIYNKKLRFIDINKLSKKMTH